MSVSARKCQTLRRDPALHIVQQMAIVLLFGYLFEEQKPENIVFKLLMLTND